MQATEGDMGINDDSGACDIAEERCNGQDDDCDGRVDEQVLAVGQRCDHNALGVCASGRFVCDRGELICEPTMEATDERCDGLDNDCDGETDEMVPNTGGACNTGRSGVCEAGIRTCLAGELSCVSIEQGSAELCNRTDDDCDGRIDENAAGVGDECDPGWAIPNCRRIARNRCEDGVLRCDEGPRPPDMCNGVDDDCDGRTGEDAQGMMCDTGALGQCAVGSQICQDADIECAPAFESTCEVDNQLDDDCDGMIDEAPEAFCAPPEQQLTRFCLSDNNQYIALDMTVDRLGEIYVSRASLVQGNLNFTHVRRDGTHDNTRVQGRVSIFPNLSIEDTDLIVEDGLAHICFRNARTRVFQYGVQNPDGAWNIENIPADGDGGIECAIGLIRGRPVVAYRQNGELMFAERQADATWITGVADAVANSNVGLELDMQIHDDVPYIAHRDAGALSFRLSFRRGGNWRTVAGPLGQGLAGGGFGFRPSLLVTNDQITVIHGDVPADVDIGSDGSLYVSSIGAELNDIFRSENLDAEGHGGGQAVMSYDGGILVAGRYRLRSALAGREDGLELYKVTNISNIFSLEAHTAADRRHKFTRISMQADPFGLPVIGFADEGSPFGGDNGFGRVCFYRPSDSDLDHVPDVIEDEIGTDPNRADTDGDGRTGRR